MRPLVWFCHLHDSCIAVSLYSVALANGLNENLFFHCIYLMVLVEQDRHVLLFQLLILVVFSMVQNIIENAVCCTLLCDLC